MDALFYTILTKLGKAKLANAIALGEKLDFITYVLGDGGGSYYEPTEEQTELKNEVWRGNISIVQADTDNPNWITIETMIPASEGGFMIREAGIFDADGDLIAIGKYPETYKPIASDGATKDLRIRTIIEVSNTESITLKIDPNIILATLADLEQLEQKIPKTYVSSTKPSTLKAGDTWYKTISETPDFSGGGKNVVIIGNARLENKNLIIE